jgi:hypothetical protein
MCLHSVKVILTDGINSSGKSFSQASLRHMPALLIILFERKPHPKSNAGGMDQLCVSPFLVIVYFSPPEISGKNTIMGSGLVVKGKRAISQHLLRRTEES